MQRNTTQQGPTTPNCTVERKIWTGNESRHTGNHPQTLTDSPYFEKGNLQDFGPNNATRAFKGNFRPHPLPQHIPCIGFASIVFF